jgi:prophage antirepressor-like protein
MFVGKDVATALGYSNTRDALSKHVDAEDKGTVAIRDTAYETRVTLISYSLKGEKKVKVYMTWTLDGLRYLNSKLGYPNF